MSLDIYLTIPFKNKAYEPAEVFWINITHNLNKMANKAGLYKAMWRPEEIDADLAGDVIELLKAGLDSLKRYPSYYKTFNPSNGWGDYDGLVRVVELYLEACKKYPDATISISR